MTIGKPGAFIMGEKPFRQFKDYEDFCPPLRPDGGLVDRLRRTRPVDGRPYKSDAVRPVNPDGPEAANVIEKLERCLTNCVAILKQSGFDTKASEAALSLLQGKNNV